MNESYVLNLKMSLFLQAVMMDALVNSFVEDLKRRATQYPDDLEGHMLDHATEIDGSKLRDLLQEKT